MPTEHHDSRAGILLGLFTYLFWGLVPVYWRMLMAVSPYEATAHRILWCVPFMLVLVAARHKWRAVWAIVRNPRLLATLTLTAVLIAANWGIFVWCVTHNQLTQSSLGYYINPLLSVVLGVAFLGERMGTLRIAAVALATVGVVIQTIAGGEFPTIAVVLALCFAFYGYLRKIAGVPALEGLFIELMILMPVALGLVVYWVADGTAMFLSDGWQTDGLLVLAGPITAIPLMTFTAAAQRMRLSTLGFMQYITPSVVLLQAVLLFGERFSWIQGVSFGCVWAALVLLTLEGPAARFSSARARARARNALSPDPAIPPPE